MSATTQTVELVETKEIEMFLPVMKEIDSVIDFFSQCSTGAELASVQLHSVTGKSFS